MSIEATYKSAEFGRLLIHYGNRVDYAISELQDLYILLPDLKAQIQASTALSATEKTEALAEVDAVITKAVQDVQNFSASLG